MQRNFLWTDFTARKVPVDCGSSGGRLWVLLLLGGEVVAPDPPKKKNHSSKFFEFNYFLGCVLGERERVRERGREMERHCQNLQLKLRRKTPAMKQKIRFM